MSYSHVQKKELARDMPCRVEILGFDLDSPTIERNGGTRTRKNFPFWQVGIDLKIILSNRLPMLLNVFSLSYFWRNRLPSLIIDLAILSSAFLFPRSMGIRNPTPLMRFSVFPNVCFNKLYWGLLSMGSLALIRKVILNSFGHCLISPWHISC